MQLRAIESHRSLEASFKDIEISQTLAEDPLNILDENLFGTSGVEIVRSGLHNLDTEDSSESDTILEQLLARLPNSSDKLISVLDLEPSLVRRFEAIGGLQKVFHFFS